MVLTESLVTGEAAISDMDGLSPEEFYEMKVQDILDIIHVVRGHMTKARQLQVSVDVHVMSSTSFRLF